jgi:hypothetical protein
MRLAGPSEGWRATTTAAGQAEAKLFGSKQNRGRQPRKIAVAGGERQGHLQLSEEVEGDEAGSKSVASSLKHKEH